MIDEEQKRWAALERWAAQQAAELGLNDEEAKKAVGVITAWKEDTIHENRPAPDFETLKKRLRLPENEPESNWHRHKNDNGELGGWVQNTASVDPYAFIGNNAVVMGHATVERYSRVSGNAIVSDNARLFHAELKGNTHVSENASISDSIVVDSRVSGKSCVGGSKVIDSRVSGAALIEGDSVIIRSDISDDVRVAYKTLVDATLSGRRRLDGMKDGTSMDSSDERFGAEWWEHGPGGKSWHEDHIYSSQNKHASQIRKSKDRER